MVLLVMLARFCCCYRRISPASVCTWPCSSHGTDVWGSKGCVTIILPILQIAGAYHSMNRSGVIPWKVYCVCVGVCVWVGMQLSDDLRAQDSDWQICAVKNVAIFIANKWWPRHYYLPQFMQQTLTVHVSYFSWRDTYLHRTIKCPKWL